ncbi:MAG: hypothetical protein LKG27_01575 [Clostridiaceae bacterium]|jgi:spore germination cell wall hydrolase CwlJ-like protein|nr:hypothetical protein [Clostridiaceae bacterium]
MVDNRSAGYFGIGGSFNFKSGDISGTAAKTQDDKMGQGGEYFAQQQNEEEGKKDDKYMDRSAVLRATLNSLAMMNVANVINARKQALYNDEKKQIEELHNNLKDKENNQHKEKDSEQNSQKDDEKNIEEKIEQEYNDFMTDFETDR